MMVFHCPLGHVCVHPVVHCAYKHGLTPTCRGGGWGALPNEAPPPSPGNVPARTLMDPREDSLGSIISFSRSSHFRAVSFPVSGTARAGPAPLGIIFMLFAGLPFLVSGVPLEPHYHSPSFMSLLGCWSVTCPFHQLKTSQRVCEC